MDRNSAHQRSCIIYDCVMAETPRPLILSVPIFLCPFYAWRTSQHECTTSPLIWKILCVKSGFCHYLRIEFRTRQTIKHHIKYARSIVKSCLKCWIVTSLAYVDLLKENWYQLSIFIFSWWILEGMKHYDMNVV